jgi:hypothetical protein
MITSGVNLIFIAKRKPGPGQRPGSGREGEGVAILPRKNPTGNADPGERPDPSPLRHHPPAAFVLQHVPALADLVGIDFEPDEGETFDIRQVAVDNLDDLDALVNLKKQAVQRGKSYPAGRLGKAA